MYLPGVLSGIVPAKRFVERVDKALEKLSALEETQRTLRHGYYHIYGGLLMSQEISSAGFGEIGIIDQASLISQVMGYAYKKLQIPMYLNAEALEMWNEIGQNEFKTRQLVRTEGLSDLEFELAKARIKLQTAILAFTEEQHRLGARFASKIYREKD